MASLPPLAFTPMSSRLPPGKYFGRLNLAIEYAEGQAEASGEIFMVYKSSCRGPNHVYRAVVDRWPQVKFEQIAAVTRGKPSS